MAKQHSRKCKDDLASVEDGWGQQEDRRSELGTDMWKFLGSPVAWTLIILILSGLGIFRELLL
ncbi:MAG: hypothetical protein GY844_15215 [Bradyrhizobium sp.]|nr:hypothetical protein [Bradyrhizobium sp.]